MAQFEFYLTREDTERLWAIKEILHQKDLTGNEFAAQLLSAELRRLFPATPEFNDSGTLLNADKFKG